jgi:homoserine/homoserine lactone efflux protein
MDLQLWLAFFAASWAISFSPGPGAVAAMGAGLAYGFARGYWLTFGLVGGIVAQLAVVGAGLGALMAASSTAFTLLKWAGVAYLLWLGVQQWRAPASPLVAGPQGEGGTPASSRRALVLRGFVLNALNPKGTVFMLAVVPQFVQPAAPLLPQYAVIGATLVFTDLIVMALYTALAARVLRSLREARHVKLVNRVFGGLFIAAAAMLAGFKRSA